METRSERIDFSECYCWAGFSTTRAPDQSIIRNPSYQALLNKCIKGTRLERLEDLSIENLEETLDLLKKRNVLTIREGKYFLSFPVFFWENRRPLDDVVRQTVANFIPITEDILTDLARNVGSQRKKWLFHLLWSCVMDAAHMVWYRLLKDDKIHLSRMLDGGYGYGMSPMHRFSCGTNVYEWEETLLLVSHAPANIAHISALEKHHKVLIQSVVSGEPIQNKDAIDALKPYDLVNKKNKAQILLITRDDPLFTNLQHNAEKYVAILEKSVDTSKIEAKYNITSDHAFVILFHELSWDLLGRLEQQGSLPRPNIFAKDRPSEIRFMLSAQSGISIQEKMTELFASARAKI